MDTNDASVGFDDGATVRCFRSSNGAMSKKGDKYIGYKKRMVKPKTVHILFTFTILFTALSII